MILQYSQAVGFPNCLTFDSHFLQIVLVLALLQIKVLIILINKLDTELQLDNYK